MYGIENSHLMCVLFSSKGSVVFHLSCYHKFSNTMAYLGRPGGGAERLLIRRLVEAYLYRTLARADRDVTFCFLRALSKHFYIQPLPAGPWLAHPLCVRRHSIGARAPIPPSRYTSSLFGAGPLWGRLWPTRSQVCCLLLLPADFLAAHRPPKSPPLRCFHHNTPRTPDSFQRSHAFNNEEQWLLVTSINILLLL